MLTNREAAQARAMGLLMHLLEYHHIPDHHEQRALDIIAQYEAPGSEWPERTQQAEAAA